MCPYRSARSISLTLPPLFLLPALCVSGLTLPPASIYGSNESDGDSDSYGYSDSDSELDSDIDSEDDDIGADPSAPPRRNAEVEVKKKNNNHPASAEQEGLSRLLAFPTVRLCPCLRVREVSWSGLSRTGTVIGRASSQSFVRRRGRAWSGR